MVMHSAQFCNLSRSDGSALMASGQTVVQAAVYGPTEIKISKELYDKAVVEVSFKPKVGQSGSEERLMEYFIRNAVESVILTTLHPRSSINIIIQEIQDAGNLLACCVNAACLALLDAGIPMTGVVAATSVAFMEDRLIPFPSSKELKQSQKVSTICIESPGKSIVGIKNSSFMTTDELNKTLEIAKSEAENLFQFFREASVKRYKKDVF